MYCRFFYIAVAVATNWRGHPEAEEAPKFACMRLHSIASTFKH
jgi:hypothetical protein